MDNRFFSFVIKKDQVRSSWQSCAAPSHVWQEQSRRRGRGRKTVAAVRKLCVCVFCEAGFVESGNPYPFCGHGLSAASEWFREQMRFVWKWTPSLDFNLITHTHTLTSPSADPNWIRPPYSPAYVGSPGKLQLQDRGPRHLTNQERRGDWLASSSPDLSS